MSKTIKMVLVNGERDGWEVDISDADLPTVFYVVPHEDEGKIGACKSTLAKQEMRDKLATLAYQLDPDRSDDTHSRLYRAPELDRVPQT